MHELYAAFAIIKNQRPRNLRDEVKREDEFYESMAKASLPSRVFAMLVARIRAAAGGVRREPPEVQPLHRSQSHSAGKQLECVHLKSVP